MVAKGLVERAGPRSDNRYPAQKRKDRSAMRSTEGRVSALADLLHAPRATIAILVGRHQHPLPLPPREQFSFPLRMGEVYARELRMWISAEQQRSDQHRAHVLDQIDRGLSMIEPEVYGYDFVHSYPPCYFVG
jgi:hypothetical protein